MLTPCQMQEELVYIYKKDLKYNGRTDTKIYYDDCKSLFIEIVNNSDSSIVDNKRKTIIGVINRYPRYSYELFQEELFKAIEKLNRFNCSFFITGDFNIDLAKQNTNQQVCNYLNNIYSSECCTLIDKPTRITLTSSTILDHILYIPTT